MAYLDWRPQPGIWANGTARMSEGFWRDGNLMRFPDATDPQPWKGWTARGSTTLTGVPRAILGWRQSPPSLLRWLAISTHAHLYAQSASGVVSDITPAGFVAGVADATLGGGYGNLTYGTGTYGTSRPDGSSVTPATVGTLDVWGEKPIFVQDSDGKLYIWDLTPAHAATQVANSPSGQAFCTVTAERFLFVGSGRTLQWSDQGVETTWAASSTNQAGNITLNTEGAFRCGRRVLGTHLFFTDVDVWRANYFGAPIVYGFEPVGIDCGAISVGSPVAIDSRCVWMSQRGFFLFNGAQAQPLSCSVGDAVFSNLNVFQASKVVGVHNPFLGEVTWFYPSAASTENDSYVTWSYHGPLPHWTKGTLARTCGEASGIFANPIMCDPTGGIWNHETGYNWGGAVPFLRSGPIELGAGDQRTLVSGIIPDEKTQGDASVTLYAREFPNATETAYGPYPCTSGPPIDVLFSARQVELQVSITQPHDARIGSFRLDVQPDGER